MFAVKFRMNNAISMTNQTNYSASFLLGTL